MKSPALAILLLAAALGSLCAPESAGPPVRPATAEELRALARRPGARATMVNVWATWCAPCREEFPALLRVAAAREGRGLRLVLVSADFEDQLPAVRDFLRAHGVRDTSYIQSGAPMAFINALNPGWSGALPATLIYDTNGRMLAFWEGAADESKFAQAADQALGLAPRTKEHAP